jgi:hypothetical protein
MIVQLLPSSLLLTAVLSSYECADTVTITIYISATMDCASTSHHTMHGCHLCNLQAVIVLLSCTPTVSVESCLRGTAFTSKTLVHTVFRSCSAQQGLSGASTLLLVKIH